MSSIRPDLGRRLEFELSTSESSFLLNLGLIIDVVVVSEVFLVVEELVIVFLFLFIFEGFDRLCAVSSSYAVLAALLWLVLPMLYLLFFFIF